MTKVGSTKAGGKTNARWHAVHRMPPNATLDQRVKWHVAHAAHCACRPMPATVVAALKRRAEKPASSRIE